MYRGSRMQGRALWGLTPPPHPRGSAGRFTPHFRKRKPSQGCFAGERKSPDGETKHVKMLRRFRQLRKSYLSLSCLSGALACYLSLIVYPLPILAYLRDSLSAVICHILEVGTPILSPTYTLSPPPLFHPKPPRRERPSPPIRGLRLAAAGDVASSF